MSAPGFSSVVAGFAAIAVIGAAGPAQGQEMAMLAPLAPEYRLRDFVYKPPQGDGWRSVEVRGNVLRMVYAEDLGDGQINLRLEFVAEAQPIPDPELVADGYRLALASYEQRSAERKANLIAASPVELIADTAGVYRYTLVSKLNDRDYIEVFYVALADDKSEYLAAKLATQDSDYDRQPYYRPLFDSLSSIRFAGADREPSETATPPLADGGLGPDTREGNEGNEGNDAGDAGKGVDQPQPAAAQD